MDLSYIAPEMAGEFEEALRLGAEAGVKAVALRNKMFGKALEDLDDEDITKAKAIIERYGMKVKGVYSGVGKCTIDDPDTVEKNQASFGRILELAKIFGTDLVRVFPYQRTGVIEYEPSRLSEYIEKIRDRWAPLVRRAEEEKAVLCFEGVGSTLARTSADMKRVIDALGDSTAVGVIWEVDIAFRDGEMPSEGYPIIKEMIRDVHVKPNPELPLSGDGETYEQAILALHRDGYTGPITIEHWKTTEASLKAIEELKGIIGRLS